MIAANQEFGLYHVASLLVALIALCRWPSVRPLAVWLLVGFFFTYYGTTVPTGWVTLQRDPRYVASLTLPSVVLLAYWLRLMPRTVRWPVVLVFVGSGLFAAALDQGQSILVPHRAFTQTKYVDDSTLEPFEYVGARWILGLAKPVVFECERSGERVARSSPQRSRRNHRG